jgi:hypothetical protein
MRMLIPFGTFSWDLEAKPEKDPETDQVMVWVRLSSEGNRVRFSGYITPKEARTIARDLERAAAAATKKRVRR